MKNTRKFPCPFAVLVAGLLGLACASVPPGPSEPFEFCQDTLRQGVFNAATVRCFPEVATPLEDLLCGTDFTTHQELNHLGFGYGLSVLGQMLGEGYGVDPRLAQRWKREECVGLPAGKALQCEGRLPELTEPPWRELCAQP